MGAGASIPEKLDKPAEDKLAKWVEAKRAREMAEKELETLKTVTSGRLRGL